MFWKTLGGIFFAFILTLGGAPVSAADGDIQPWSPLVEPFKEIFSPFSDSGPADEAVVRPARVQGPPKAVVNERAYDFGAIPPEEIALHDFVIRNEGRGDLIIEKASPGCGCIGVEFDRVIPPGGEGKITVILRPYTSWSGQKFAERVLATVNDPVMSRFMLKVTGRVEGLPSGNMNSGGFPRNRGIGPVQAPAPASGGMGQDG